MLRELNIGNLKWIDAVDLNKDEIVKILESYDVHELDIEASLEGNQKARIDTYENYSFLVFHFPKYNTIRKIYELNEYNIFLGKDFLITFRDFHGNKIDKIFDYYKNQQNLEELREDDDEIKITTGYILYEIIQYMLEKMFRVTRLNTKDMRILEQKVFESDDYSLVREIMMKKRNIILIKNMFKPQVMMFKQLEYVINKMYEGEMEVYFEDLEDIDSIEDTFKTMLDIKTNSIIKFLTLFSAFMLPLTLITSFYGMNVDNLPFVHDKIAVYWILIISIVFMVVGYIYLKKKGRF
ncbi:magnesium transporter CorA family protein [Candidatus Gracilibacteria bacterium]|nr:magnesium transporter CorA family protein [Candidatus Gracilibacteria bacterium]